MKAKQRARLKILEYIGDPENDFPNRGAIAKKICGYSDHRQLYKVFTVSELDQLEKEGMEIRRRRSTRIVARVDQAIIKQAMQGDVRAARLVFAKLEGWTEAGVRNKKKDSKGQLDRLCEVMAAGPVKRSEGQREK